MKTHTADSITIQGKNGCWSVQVTGKGNRGTVIALHGFARDRGYFGDLLQALGDEFLFLVPDLPFHGESDWSADRFSREDIRELLEQLYQLPACSSPVYLMGHSMGARILLSVWPDLSFSVRRVIALAPDGLGTRGNFFSEGIPLWGRTLCKNILLKPSGLLRTGNMLHALRLLSAFQYRYLQRQLADEESSRRLYHTWLSMYDFSIRPKLIRRHCAVGSGKLLWVLGSLDKIVSVERAHQYLRWHKLDTGNQIWVLQDGHELKSLDGSRLFE